MAIQKSLVHALDMLPHLAFRAKARQTITYKELGELIGLPPLYMKQSLDFLRDKILPNHNLPRLDALIVNTESREVGDSFYEGGKGGIADADFKELLDSEREKVYAYGGWDEVIPRLQAHYGGEEYAEMLGRKKPL